MAKQRIQVGPLADPVPLTPRAAPVDTFHAPDVKAPRQGATEMAQLSEALSQFNPHLLALGVDLHREQAANENTAGAEKIRTDARLQNRKGFNEAIKAGLIPEAKSPYFLKGMEEQLARIESDRFDGALREFYAKSKSQHQPDITDFIGGFTSDYLKLNGLEGGSPEFQTVFQNNLSNSISNLQTQHVQRWETEQSQIVRDRLYQETATAVDSLVYRSHEDQALDIQNRVSSLVTNGLSGHDANKAVIDAIHDKAREHGDASILDLMDHIDTGNGKLGKTQYAKDMRDQAEQHIFARQREVASAEWTNHEHNKKLASENLWAEAATRIGKDPTSDISDLTSMAEKIDPQTAKNMREYKDYVHTQNLKVYEDPNDVSKLYSDIYAGTATHEQIAQMVQAGKLNPDRVAYAHRDLEEAKKHTEALSDPDFNRVIEETATTITNGEYQATPETRAKALAAKNLLRRSIIEFRTKNPNASHMETYDQLVKNQGIVLKGVSPDSAVSLPPSTTGAVLGPKLSSSSTGASAPAQTKPLYTDSASLKQDIAAYNTAIEAGSGADSRLAIRAEARGMSVDDFVRAESKLLRKNTPKK
jgi:hypothetical protein